MTEKVVVVKPSQIQKFIKKKMENVVDDRFEEQLKEEIMKKMAMQERITTYNLKRSLAQQKVIKMAQEKQEYTRKQLQLKLERSEKKRVKENREKVDSMMKQRKYRDELFHQRLNLMKQEERQRTKQKLMKYNQKVATNPEQFKTHNNLKLEEEPHYLRMKQSAEFQYQDKKKKVENRKAFQKVLFQRHQRVLSNGNLQKRNAIYEDFEREQVNKMGEHLQKIESTRKKKSDLINKKIKKSKSLQNYAMEQQKERLKEMEVTQNKKNRQLLAKLTRQTPSRVGHTKNPSAVNSSIISSMNEGEVTEGKQSNYRREIQKHINEYFEKQKISSLKVSGPAG